MHQWARILSHLWLLSAQIVLASGSQAADLTTKDLDTPSAPALSVSFSHRTRYESLNNQFRAGQSGSDSAVLLRTMLRAELRGERFRAVGELVDGRVYRAALDGAVDGNAVNALEPVQAYLGLHLGDPSAGADIIAGRYSFNLGSGRLVGRNGFRNVPNAYAGIKGKFTLRDDDRLTAFWLVPQNRLPATGQAVLDNEIKLDRVDDQTQLWGLHYDRRYRADTRIEAYALALTEQDGHRPTSNRRLQTLGFRMYRQPGLRPWDLDLEAALQLGRARASAAPTDRKDLDVRATMLHAELGYRFATKAQLRLALLWDYASGDRNPNDRSLERFDPLFGPIAGDLGPTSLLTYVTRSNLNSPAVRLQLKPTARLSTALTWRAVRLASARDSLGGAGVVDPSGASGRAVGQQLDLRARWELIPRQLHLEVGAALFANGSYLKSAPNATGEGDTTYGYLSLSCQFKGS